MDEENPFKRIKIPLIRRIYPQLLCDDEEEKEPVKKSKYRSIDDPWEVQDESLQRNPS